MSGILRPPQTAEEATTDQATGVDAAAQDRVLADSAAGPHVETTKLLYGDSAAPRLQIYDPRARDDIGRLGGVNIYIFLNRWGTWLGGRDCNDFYLPLLRVSYDTTLADIKEFLAYHIYDKYGCEDPVRFLLCYGKVIPCLAPDAVWPPNLQLDKIYGSMHEVTFRVVH